MTWAQRSPAAAQTSSTSTLPRAINQMSSFPPARHGLRIETPLHGFPVILRVLLRVRLRILFSLFLALATTSPLIEAKEPLVLLVDEWHLLYLSGVPAGYTHFSIQPTASGYRTTTRQTISLKRSGTAIKLESNWTIQEDSSGRVLSFDSVQTNAAAPLRATGSRQGNILEISEWTDGSAPQQKRVELADDVVGPAYSVSAMRSRLRRQGDELTLNVFAPEYRRAVKQSARRGGEEEIVVLDGARKRFTRLELSVDGIAMTQWVDAEFTAQRSEMVLAGLKLVTHLAQRERVLAFDFSSPPEVFVTSFVRVKRPVSPRAQRAEYILRLKQGTFAQHDDTGLLATAGQKHTMAADKKSLTLQVRRVELEQRRTLPLRVPSELQNYVGGSSYLQTGDDELIKLTRRVVDTERDALSACELLARWVHDNVGEKNLETGFATAKEVYLARRGDCTEHAVLLAALCRIAGVPSRVVAGMTYHQEAFIGHMWTEVHVGKWIPLDATSPSPRVGADHIGFSSSSLETAGFMDIFPHFVHIIGNLEIEVKDVE